MLDRSAGVHSVPVQVQPGDVLQIFVENQGRVCYGGSLSDRKGIVGNVTLGPDTLTSWTMSGTAIGGLLDLVHDARLLLQGFLWTNQRF